MFRKVEIKDSDVCLTLSPAQVTSLQSAWCLFKGNVAEHARNIFATFYEQNPDYLKYFDSLGNAAMHQHTEHVLESIGDLIERGLKDKEIYNRSLYEIVKVHHGVTQKEINKLHEIIRKEFLHQIKNHKTKTLEQALDLLLKNIELNFQHQENNQRKSLNST